MEYSQEQLNYFRLCYIAFDLVPVGLRQIFKNEWDFRYKATLIGEWKDTAQNGLDFYNNESKASHKKNARCLATIHNGDTAKWDCTCLFFAILYSDTVGTTLSPAVYKVVDDIRQVRNEIAHITEAKLTDADFQTSVDRLLNDFTSLGLAITEIQEIKNQTTFPTMEVENIKKEARNLQAELDLTKSTLQSTEAALVSLTQEISVELQPFYILASCPPHDTIRRSHDIERITNEMQELYKSSSGAVSTVYLSGNPGCGKSQLAREIGQQFFSEQTDNLIFAATINTESVETLADSYLTLGRHLGITEYALTSLESLKREKPIEAIQTLHRLILPKTSKFIKWLIIADNVIDLRVVRDLLPQTGSKEWGHGQVLITTQDSGTIPQNAPHTYHESLSKGMRRKEAVELLETVSQISEPAQAENVAELLDFQPLALAAAAYYVQTVVNSGSSNYDWKAYLQDISTYSQRKEAETVLASESSAYAKTTMAAVEMAIQRAVETDEVLLHTYSFLSLCANDDVPLETVLKFVKAQVKDHPEVLIKANIVRSSLSLVHSEEGGERTYLRLHKVVHEALKRGEIPYLKSFESNHTMAEAVKIFKVELDENDGNYAFGEDHSNVATSYNNLALVYKRLGEYNQAKQLYEKALTIRKKIFGEDHADVATSYNGLASVYNRLGQYNQAKELYEKALLIRKKIFGEDHADVATSYNNLALVYDTLGEYNQAKELHEKALIIRKKIFGEDHADVASSYNNLASVYYNMKEYNQAKELYEKALTIRKKIFGEDHADVATSYNDLALVYDTLGEYNQAKELHEKALIIRKKIFGEDHADVATSYNNLALVYDTLGEYNQAKELYEKALIIYKKIFGEDHADVATSYNNLALVYNHLGENSQAKELHEKALKIYKKIFGEDHANVATSYSNLALMYKRLGEFNQAKELYEKALIIRKQIFGEDHVYVETVRSQLALVNKHLGSSGARHAKAYCLIL